VTPVLELPTTGAVKDMIQHGRVATDIDGVVVQNGLTTTQTNGKMATGEEV